MKPHKKRDERKPRTVLVLMVAVRWDIDKCGREIMALSKRLQRWPFHPTMHSKRQVAYVIETDLTAKGLVDSLGHTSEAGCIENIWAFTPGKDIASIMPLDPLTERIQGAWANVRKWNDPKNMRPPKAPQIFINRGIKDGERGARVKMGIKPRSVRQAP